MKNIILVGFMGTGKTAVGKALAKRLGLRFVDMDDIIEEREGMKISEIFKKKGERYFRHSEGMVARDIALQAGLVVAAGGGAVIDGENVKNLKSNGVMFCLFATPERIFQRTKGHTHRPLLNVSDPEEKINELMAKRAEYYARADYRIDTSDLSVNEVADKITEYLK
ncbi:MAG: shikimate kinase [Candidatus Omnitrophota bacterium]